MAVDWWLWVAAWAAATTAVPLPQEVDSEQTRKLLGESVVTSVSVIMDHGNGTKTYLTDDKLDEKPQIVGTPGTLLSPDRYEFYTFGEDGELVKKLMSMDQIQSLIAGGSESDELEPLPVYYPQPLVDSSTHNEGVSKVLETVQNLLKGELQAAKEQQRVPPVPMPDHSWSILLPGLINGDSDYREPTVPLNKEPTAIPTVSNDIYKLPSTRIPSTTESQKRPMISSTTTMYTTPSRPESPSTTFQKVSTSSSTTKLPQSTSAKKPSTEFKYPTNHITPPPNTKTTGHLVTKVDIQKPVSTTKRPPVSTKKPYVSDSPYSKIPLSTTRPDMNLRPMTPIKNPPAGAQERISSTKPPEIKKPLPEKQKPSGIPTITHYMPISSSSSPSNVSTNVTNNAQQEYTPVKQKITATTKEPIRTTTKPPVVKPPPSQGVNQKLTQTTTKRPIKPSQGKPSSTQHKNPTNTRKPSPVKPKPKPTPSTTHNGTKTYNRTTSTTHPVSPTKTKNRPKPTTTTAKPTTTTAKPTTTTEKLTATTEKLTTTTTKPTTDSISANYQLVNISTKQTPPPNSPKPVNTKKPDVPKPLSNLVGQSSNTVNSKVKPPTQPTPIARPTTTPKTKISLTTTTRTTSTKPPEKITTFSYTSKLTPMGDIVTSPAPTTTTQRRVPTVPVLSTMTQTNRNGTTNTKVTEPLTTTTEKTVMKITQQHQSASILQATKGHQPAPLQHKPTTYHPQNFHSSSKRPMISSSQESTSSFPESMGMSFEALKISTTKLPNTAKPTMSSTSKPTSQSTETQKITTYQATTKPTTDVSQDGTTLATTPSSITETTQNGMNMFSTDDMPLQEIPLKIYESLKDNIGGSQDIMTTIISENLLSTTTGKMESSYTTAKLEDITLTSTLPASERTTVTTSTQNGSPTEISDKAGSTNKPFTQTVDSTTTTMQTTLKNKFPETDNFQGSASMPEEQRNNITKTNNASALLETSTTTTSEYTNSSEPGNSETTTNMDSTTIYKDQILQDGISAVTSILLDEAQRQQTMKEHILASVIKKDESKEKFRTTTESEPTSTTDTYSEMETRHSSDTDEMKSEVRLNEDTELPEKGTTERVETTTVQEKYETTTAEDKQEITVTQKSTTTEKPKITTPIVQENKTTNVIKPTKQKPAPILPTKESKLNPDIDPNIEILKIKPEPTESIRLRTTSVPLVTPPPGNVKLAEFQEKSVPKPFSKKPNPAYQPLESFQPPAAIELHPAPYESMGLEASIAFLSEDVRRFADLCNELAFRMWTSITGKGQISSRSLVISPFAVTSLLAMVFLGARGPTSGQMNDVLRLDDMVTFNPHQVLQNVTDSVINSKIHGVATAAFVRELYSDKVKGKILDFYKERVQQYYQGHVEEVTFSMIGDIIRRRTNLLVKRQTLGKVPEYLRGSSLNMRPPLAAFSANIFQTDCDQGSTDGRDGEMYFVVRPSTRQRRLVPVPAVVWRTGFLTGYEPSLDATSVCLGADSVVSTILILPGQQGQVAPGDGLARLEQRLIETSYRRGGWSRLLRSLMIRPGLELQIPRFSHRSVLNVTGALQRMGLRDLFNNKADLRGLNGLSNDLHLSDMLQVNTFSTCGEETIGARHHVETYPASPQRMGRDRTEVYRDFDAGFGDVTLSLRPRQARLPDNPRLRFDRPFLYMVRHNPSGMILHMGRFNPRLLP